MKEGKKLQQKRLIRVNGTVGRETGVGDRMQQEEEVVEQLEGLDTYEYYGSLYNTQWKYQNNENKYCNNMYFFVIKMAVYFRK